MDSNRQLRMMSKRVKRLENQFYQLKWVFCSLVVAFCFKCFSDILGEGNDSQYGTFISSRVAPSRSTPPIEYEDLRESGPVDAGS